MKDNIFINIAKYLIKFLVFLIPVFFLPLTTGQFEHNKFNLLCLFTSIAFMLWLLGMASNRKLEFKRTPLDYPIIIFIFILLLSSQFSVDKHQSFFGSFGFFHISWLAWLSLSLLYFCIVNLFSSRDTVKIFYCYLISISIVIALALLSNYGLFLNLSGNSLLNVSGGNFGNLAFLISAILVLLISLLVFNFKINSKYKYLIITLTALILLLLILINFSPAWWGILIGSLITIGLAVVTLSKQKDNILGAYLRIALIFIPAFISGLFVLASDNGINSIINSSKINMPSLGLSESINLSRQAVKYRPVLGSGPGTFSILFSRYRTSTYNYLPDWQIRHNQSGSFLLELIATTGIIAIFSYLLIIGLFIYFTVFFLLKGLIFNQPDWPLTLALSMAAVVLIIGQAIYTVSIVGLFSFWLFIALAAIQWREAARNIRIKGINLFNKKQYLLNSKQKLLGVNIIILIIFSGLAAAISLLGKFYLADYYFAKAGGRTEPIVRAINLNPGQYQYQLILSQELLGKIKTKTADNTNVQKREDVQKLIDESVSRARTATEIAPKSVAAWETLGIIYRDIAPLAKDSEIWAAKAFEEAFKLEPSNPVIATELGKAYLDSGNIKEAIATFNEATLLKSDYYEAQFGLARAYSRQNNYREAVNLLERLIVYHPVSEVYYELGRLYYNQGEVDSAIRNFKEVMVQVPNHSNAIYSLGLAYELKGQEEEALNYFKKVLELNPGNQEVMNKIKITEDNIGL